MAKTAEQIAAEAAETHNRNEAKNLIKEAIKELREEEQAARTADQDKQPPAAKGFWGSLFGE